MWLVALVVGGRTVGRSVWSVVDGSSGLDAVAGMVLVHELHERLYDGVAVGYFLACTREKDESGFETARENREHSKNL